MRKKLFAINKVYRDSRCVPATGRNKRQHRGQDNFLMTLVIENFLTKRELKCKFFP